MIRIVCQLHWYHDDAKVLRVVEEMRTRGAPILRGYMVDDLVLLREGTHRIEAALRIGLPPAIVPIRWWRSAESLQRARFAAAQRGVQMEVTVAT